MMARMTKAILCTMGVLILTAVTYISAGDWIPNTKCVKVWGCTGGSSTGSCEAHGFFCVDTGCASYGEGEHRVVPNTCNWTVTANCVSDPNRTCKEFEQQWMPTDCDGYCKLVFYNDCTCACQDSGQGADAGTSPDCYDTLMGCP